MTLANEHCTAQVFQDFFADALSEDDAKRVASHLRGCQACRDRAVMISEGLLWADSWTMGTRQESEFQARFAAALLREEANERAESRKLRLRWWHHHLTEVETRASGHLPSYRYSLQARAIRLRSTANPPATMEEPVWLVASGTPARLIVPANTEVLVESLESPSPGSMIALIPADREGETLFAAIEPITGTRGATPAARFRKVPAGEYILEKEPLGGDQATEPRRPKP